MTHSFALATSGGGVRVRKNSAGGTGSASFQAASTDTGDGTDDTVVFTKPTGLAAEDVMFVSIGVANNGISIAEPDDDWNVLYEADDTQGGGSNTYYLAYKVADAGDAAATDFTFTLGSNQKHASGMVAIRGLNPDDPIDATLQTLEGDGADPDPPAITAGVSNAFVLTGVIKEGAGNSLPPSGYDERVDVFQSGGTGSSRVSNWIATKTSVPVGSENPGIFDDSFSDIWLAYTISFKPLTDEFGPRSRLNFIEGSNVQFSIADDIPNDEIDITVSLPDDLVIDSVGKGATSERIAFGNAAPNEVEILDDANVSRFRLNANSTGSWAFKDSTATNIMVWDDTNDYLRFDKSFQFFGAAPLRFQTSAEAEYFYFDASSQKVFRLYDNDTANRLRMQFWSQDHATDASDIAFYDGDGSTVSLQWDESDDQWEFGKAVDFAQPVTGIAHSEIETVGIDDHHARDHAASHSDGGADEIDVVNLASAGASGSYLERDGAGGLQWSVPAGGGSGLDLTTKGEIHTHNASADAALTVGANGTLLQADSAEATGLGWDTELTGEYRITGAPNPLTLGAAGDTQFRLVENANDFTVQVGNNANTFVNRMVFYSTDDANGGDWVLNDQAGLPALTFDQSTDTFDFADHDITYSGNLVSGFNNIRAASTAGTAAAPAYSFGNDTNLGMYRAGTDDLGFSGNGSERIRFDMATGGGGIRTDQSAVYAPLMESVTLTDEVVGMSGPLNSWEQWGTEEINIAWPSSTPCRVMAWGMGRVEYNGGGGRKDNRVTISFDGGSTWDTPGDFISNYIDSGDTYGPVFCSWMKSGTPTGNIQVRMEWRLPNDETNFIDGRIFCLVLGDI